MYLYNFTLQKPTAIHCAAQGNFSGARTQEIAVSRGRYLELLRPDVSTGKMITLLTHDVFGVISSLIAFRLPSGLKDFLIVGSDSGRITILEFNQSKNIFERIHLETFGKSGFRRMVPGKYLSMDPKGRAVMISALEKQKFVYVLNRDNEARLTISSPLEAHKSHSVVFATVGMDVGYENPIFACLEMDYEEADSYEIIEENKQLLTFYELDLGLNHVVRKSSEPLDHFANIILPVPGSGDGPGGVILCCENFIIYKNINENYDNPIMVPIPKRKDDIDNPDRKSFIVCGTAHKTKSMFFFLVQSDLGDLFKVTLEFNSEKVYDMQIKYFDTLENLATSLIILRSGFLFAASEYGNHQFYQIIRLGDDDDGTQFLSSHYQETEALFYFQPRELLNLFLVSELNNISPIMDSHIVDIMQNDSPQIHILCGRGKSSQFGVFYHGLEVNEMAVSDLPGEPVAVWSLKNQKNDVYDSFIVVSFVNATLVLSVGETVEEVAESGFLSNVSTLGCGLLGDDSIVQIYSEGIRHIKSDKRINEWRCPAGKIVLQCTINNKQIAITMTGNELVYFELDQMGQLSEYTERKEMPSEVVCVCLGPVPKDEQRSKFMAIALKDNTVRIITLDPADCLRPLSMQALPACAESLCIIETSKSSIHSEEIYYDSSNSMGLYLHIGLSNGVLLRTVLDPVTGDLTDTRTRYLGARTVKLFKLNVLQCSSVMAISSRNWLSYQYQHRFHLTPLSFDTLEYATGFSSEQCPEGLVAVKGNVLYILEIDKLGSIFEYRGCPLKYTPRKFLFEENSQKYVIIETDHNSYTQKELVDIKNSMAEEMRDFMREQEDCDLTEETINDFLNSETAIASKAGPGTWASLVRIIDPLTFETHCTYEFEQDEAAFCMTFAKFPSYNNDRYVVVGTSKKYVLSPRHCTMGFLHTFRIVSDKSTEGRVLLEHVHKTPIDEVPGAIACYQGRLLVGIRNMLRIYDMGRQKLLKKCENRKIPYFITNINVFAHRIIVQDVQESFHFLKYKPKINDFIVFADDTYPRWITKSCSLDWNTVIGADKFGNISVNRLPDDVKDDIDEDPTGVVHIWEKGKMHGAPQKLVNICSYHLGETIHSLQKATLITGGSESIVYTTLSGTIGLFVALATKEEVEFFQLLEMHMRQEVQPLCGRDHIAFRSTYWPCKCVIDGDLCELYNNFDADTRASIADEIERTSVEVSKKLEEIRTRFAF